MVGKQGMKVDSAQPSSSSGHPEGGAPMCRRRRNRPGRADRQRRRKVKKLFKLDSASGQHASSFSIPDDRDLTLPSVMELRKRCNFNVDDEQALLLQLGYVPGNVLQVVARARDVPCLLVDQKSSPDAPVAIQLYPLVVRKEHTGGKTGNSKKSRKRKRYNATADAGMDPSRGEVDGESTLIEPFPTTYWLTHPHLRVLISKLEVSGLGVELEKRLAHDGSALAQMQRAHQAYGRQRRDLLTDEDWSMIQTRKWEESLAESRGVAGIRNYASVKCLHAHAAHYLAAKNADPGAEFMSNTNIVGQWVMEAVTRLVASESTES